MRRAGRPPTIVDIARLAGVSKSTVARALAGDHDISETTRDAVLKVAQAAGYERNRLAVGMRSGRSGLLGLVIPDIANPFWAEVARGAQDRAQEAGSSLMILSSDWDHDLEAQHLRTLRQARVDGAIVNPVDAVRTGALLLVEGPAAFGAASLAFLRFTGGAAGAALWLAASIVVWMLAPLAAAVVRLNRADI